MGTNSKSEKEQQFQKKLQEAYEAAAAGKYDFSKLDLTKLGEIPEDTDTNNQQPEVSSAGSELSQMKVFN